jgi:hypothetical protein
MELTDGARVDSPLQKTIFDEYAAKAVQREAGHLLEFAIRCPLYRRLHNAINLTSSYTLELSETPV